MTTPHQQQPHLQQQQRYAGQATPLSMAPATPTQNKVKIVAGYALQQRLGSGSFATVYKGVKVDDGQSSTSMPSLSSTSQQQQHQQQQQQPPPNRTDNKNHEGAQIVAIKAITRASEKLTKKVLENLEMEISILRTYQHPNIVCLQQVQRTERHFYLILEYCGGGDLQRLIRTRKTGRLTERLTRRLMRDLSAGLRFLWGQELIHRDIKPQNLLLTGALPLDELHDPAKMDVHEDMRRQANFPSSEFALKIADFGFARHLQTASLADTLCGSPLYMAPEILQHHRYDAKADLWSVGTVLFEMIAGRPPFNGENHIDLLRNIQRKAVRLPADVRVSKECVKLLRILLNRNPLSRAGFKEFFEASDAFVALGCEGVDKSDAPGFKRPSLKMDLGTIHESEGAAATATAINAAMAMDAESGRTHPTPDRTTPVPAPMLVGSPPLSSGPSPAPAAMTGGVQTTPGFVTPPLGPVPAPPPPTTLSAAPTVSSHTNPATAFPTRSTQYSPDQQQNQQQQQQQQHTTHPKRFTPLQPSPPQGPTEQHHSPGQLQLTNYNTGALHPPSFGNSISNSHNQGSQNSSGDESGFVMVEHGNMNRSGSLSATAVSATNTSGQRFPAGRPLTASPPASPRYVRPTTQGDYYVVKDNPPPRHVPRGMLSTSPGTGLAFLGFMSRPRLLTPGNPSSMTPTQLESQLSSTTKMIAVAEDIGRRAISVAHLGDVRAYMAMKLVFGGSGGSSLFSASPMEGVEEEKSDDHSSANVSDSEDNSSATEPTGQQQRQRAISTDRSLTRMNTDDDGNEHGDGDGGNDNEDNGDEMPFAFPSEDEEQQQHSKDQSSSSAMAIPARSSSGSSMQKRSSLTMSKPVSTGRPNPATIRVHFGEALACYLKAMSMLKKVLGNVQKVRTEMETWTVMNNEQRSRLETLSRRCDVTYNWLSGQFSGVLERAEAANTEIGKLSANARNNTTNLPVPSVQELIYNHSLASGRDGAVKQLLGQYDAARLCYRSAGLLAETLLMEPNVSKDDRRVLEGYVDSFAARIVELDQLMLQQSRGVTGSSSTSSNHQPGSGVQKRGSGVIGLIGGIPPPNAGFSPPPFPLGA